MENTSVGVRDFYAQQNVFLTGATGFLGKAVLEKLLRSCPEVNTVYILVREKPGSNHNIQTRLQKLLESPLFNTLKATENGNILKKICPIKGDIALPSLGIKLRDRILLTSRVSVVIHGAATIKFNERVSNSVELNVNGLRRIIDLCKEIKHLKSFVHISTAFANCDRTVIEEKVYPPPVGSVKLIEYLCQSNRSDSMNLAEIPFETGNGQPNTYTFTKAVAEHILTLEAGELPVCIVRPSIVSAACKEPVQGWIDNINGPTGIFVAIGLGQLRVLIADSGKKTNMIPVDVVASLVLCAAWETSSKEKSYPDSSVVHPIKVYNCCSSSKNSLMIGRVPKLLVDNFRYHVPLSKATMYPGLIITTNRLHYSLMEFCMQYFPAFCMDLFSGESDSKKSILKQYQKFKKAYTASLEYFNLKEWEFVTDNMTCLFNSLNDDDKQHFFFSVDDINWTEYFKIYTIGIRKYILKDEDSTLPIAKNRAKLFRKFYLLINFFAILTITFITVMIVFWILYITF